MIFRLTDKLIFPNPSLADEDGLLAVGGDLSTGRLILAYSLGIFPWYSEGEPILWHSPHRRFVLFSNELHISHSMRTLINTGKYKITKDTAFETVINKCSKAVRKGQKGTWINKDMIEAYIRLHEKSLAHSIEVWDDGQLAGGLYGVETGKIFCGESMFSTKANTSKLALITLCSSGYDMIDCQTYTPHLESMGARFISRDEFLEKLQKQ